MLILVHATSLFAEPSKYREGIFRLSNTTLSVLVNDDYTWQLKSFESYLRLNCENLSQTSEVKEKSCHIYDLIRLHNEKRERVMQLASNEYDFPEGWNTAHIMGAYFNSGWFVESPENRVKNFVDYVLLRFALYEEIGQFKEFLSRQKATDYHRAKRYFLPEMRAYFGSITKIGRLFIYGDNIQCNISNRKLKTQSEALNIKKNESCEDEGVECIDGLVVIQTKAEKECRREQEKIKEVYSVLLNDKLEIYNESVATGQWFSDLVDRLSGLADEPLYYEISSFLSSLKNNDIIYSQLEDGYFSKRVLDWVVSGTCSEENSFSEVCKNIEKNLAYPVDTQGRYDRDIIKLVAWSLYSNEIKFILSRLSKLEVSGNIELGPDAILLKKQIHDVIRFYGNELNYFDPDTKDEEDEIDL